MDKQVVAYVHSHMADAAASEEHQIARLQLAAADFGLSLIHI